MSKRTRHKDNSKRQQPIQQQRAQARQLEKGGTSPKGSNANQQQPQQGERDSGTKR